MATLRGALFLFVVALVAAACGGGGGGGGGSTPSPSGQTRISGSAVKGTFSSGTVTVYAVTASGMQGSVLGMGALEPDGSFSVDIGNHSGPVMVEVSAGEYRNEVDGMSTMQMEELNGLIPNAPAGMISNITVTPLTTLAASFAAGNVITGDIPATINAANARIAAYFSLPDLMSVTPVDLGTTTATAGSDPAIYGLVLAGFSRLAELYSVEASELVEAVALDVRDGVFDGLAGSTQITINSQNLLADTMQGSLASAMQQFLNSANNASGITINDMTDYVNQLANRSQNTLFPVSIEITPDPAEVAFNATLQMTATATMSDASTVDVTNSVNWSSTNTSDATVDASGLVSGVMPGGAMIAAQSQEDLSVTDSVMLTVTNPITSITVTPSGQSIAQNATQAFTAMATRADNTMEDVTSSITWESSNTSIATINASGVATGVGPGTTMIRATDAATNETDAVMLTVTPIIASIAITPSMPMISLGSSAQLTATATLTDSSTMDVTNSVMWKSQNSNTASVSASGNVTGQALGTTTITATDPGTNVMGQATVQVTDVITSVAITPTNGSVAAGLTQQMTATGNFSGGGNTDLTNSVNWQSTNTSVATIDASGLVTAVTIGQTMITCTDPATNLMDSVTLTVSAPVVSTIAVSPNNPSVAAGATQQFTAMATMSDGSMMDVTGNVMWTSSSQNTATINNSGLASSANQGSTTITARDVATNVTGTSTLTVTPPAIVSISISPNGSIQASSVRKLSATAMLSNGTMQNVTSSVTWMSSNTSAAVVTNNGWLMTRSSGSTSITATHAASNTMGSETVTVSGGAPNVSFNGQVRPIFNSNCTSCHGANGGLSLTSYNGVISGGNSGAAVQSGNGPGSLIMMRMLADGAQRMPQGGQPLSESNLTTILRWIDQGAQNN